MKNKLISQRLLPLFLPFLILFLAGGIASYYWFSSRMDRTRYLLTWLHNPSQHPGWAITALDSCPQAPFLFPSTGYIGYRWGDSFRPGHKHQGIDIFAAGKAGSTPVYAAYDGYLTRLPDWKASVIIRIPEDPLQPNRQIWTYYTHLADENGKSFISDQFPPGSQDMFVEQGSLLGYQGNYSGKTAKPVGVHLHFSIVKDDEQGHFKNELEMTNTLDPSPYLGLPLTSNHTLHPPTKCLNSDS